MTIIRMKCDFTKLVNQFISFDPFQFKNWHIFIFEFKMRFFQKIILSSTLLTLWSFSNVVDSHKILGVIFSPMKSHYIFAHALMKGLAEDGNEVTFISPVKSESSIKNLREIFVDLSTYSDRMFQMKNAAK